MDRSAGLTQISCVLPASKGIILWSLFFVLCFGLGYPTLNRYDESKLDVDVAAYSRMVLHQASREDVPFNVRLLVPEVARSSYLLAREHLGTWNPVAFGLLVSNSFFCATAAFFFLLVGLHTLRDFTLVLFGVSLYLLNFVVPNVFLSGLVDTSEACLMLALIWALISGRWFLLPVIGILGGVAKQSFLPFSVVFVLTWWLSSKNGEKHVRQLWWLVALAATNTASLVLAHRCVVGTTISPLAMASWWSCEGSYFTLLVKEFTDKEFWYVFIWLLPLGLFRLKRLPVPWVSSSLVTGLLAIGLGAYANSLGSVCRPLFSVAGPVLTLSAAMFLAESRRPNAWQSSPAIDPII